MIANHRTTETHRRTGYGAAYEIIRGVIEQAEICDSQTSSTKIGDGLDDVSAEAAIKEGQLIVFAINKTTQDVTLHLKFSDQPNSHPLSHQALSFSDANSTTSFEMGASVLTTVESSEATATYVLPPLWLNQLDEPVDHSQQIRD